MSETIPPESAQNDAGDADANPREPKRVRPSAQEDSTPPPSSEPEKNVGRVLRELLDLYEAVPTGETRTGSPPGALGLVNRLVEMTVDTMK